MHVYMNVCKHYFNVFLYAYLISSLQSTSDQREVKDPAKDSQYSEPQIDAMRAQKDQVTCEYNDKIYNCLMILDRLLLL